MASLYLQWLAVTICNSWAQAWFLKQSVVSIGLPVDITHGSIL